MDLYSDDETTKDVLDAVKTIRKRSTALMNFVDDYRKFTRLMVVMGYRGGNP